MHLSSTSDVPILNFIHINGKKASALQLHNTVYTSSMHLYHMVAPVLWGRELENMQSEQLPASHGPSHLASSWLAGARRQKIMATSKLYRAPVYLAQSLPTRPTKIIGTPERLPKEVLLLFNTFASMDCKLRIYFADFLPSIKCWLSCISMRLKMYCPTLEEDQNCMLDQMPRKLSLEEVIKLYVGPNA